MTPLQKKVFETGMKYLEDIVERVRRQEYRRKQLEEAIRLMRCEKDSEELQNIHVMVMKLVGDDDIMSVHKEGMEWIRIMANDKN